MMSFVIWFVRKSAISVMLIAACILPHSGNGQPAAQKAAAKQASAGKRLPDSALKKAQVAEKELKANRPLEAITILSQIEKENPGFSAVSLRIAQIYDQMDQPGAALHYYRRYVHLAGGSARDEAVSRVTSLELMPSARQDADDLGARLGQAVAPVATPVPEVQREVAAEREDGSLVPIRGADELQKITTNGLPPPEPADANPTPLMLPDNQTVSLPKSRSSNARDVLVGSDAAKTPISRRSGAASQPPLDISVPLSHAQTQLPPLVTSTPFSSSGAQPSAMATAPSSSGASTQALKPAPVAASQPAALKSSVYAGVTPAAGAADEDALLAQSFAAGSSAPVAELTPVMQSNAGAPLPDLAARREQVPSRKATAKPGSVAYFKPTPETKVVSPRAAGFFTSKPVQGTKASVKISNGIPDSVATFVIIPDDDGEAINAILANGESRSFQIAPGTHEVSVNIATSNYPPLPLMDVRFDFQFEAGTQYIRRLTQDSLQQVQ